MLKRFDKFLKDNNAFDIFYKEVFFDKDTLSQISERKLLCSTIMWELDSMGYKFWHELNMKWLLEIKCDELWWYDEYAQKSYTKMALSEYAPNIIKRIKACGGMCPCKKGDETQKCPCPDHAEEVEENGHCTCHLFVKVIDVDEEE